MEFLKKLFGSYATKLAIADAEKLENVISSFGNIERTHARAGTAAAMAFILKDAESRGDDSAEMIVAGMHESIIFDQKQIRKISELSVYLMNAQKQAFASNSPVNRLIASGIPIWITSIRATYTIEILPYARRIWALLDDYDYRNYSDIFDEIAKILGPNHPMATSMRGASLLRTPPLFLAR